MIFRSKRFSHLQESEKLEDAARLAAEKRFSYCY